MTGRMINMKCEYGAIDKEIAAIPSYLSHLVDIDRSKKIGYPVFSAQVIICDLECRFDVDMQLLVHAGEGDMIRVAAFINAESAAIFEGMLLELQAKKAA